MKHSAVHVTSTRRGRLLEIARRHPLRIWVLWALGLTSLIATLRFAAVDPAFIVLFIDPELAAAIVLVAVALLRADVARCVSLSAHRLGSARDRLRQ